MPRGRIVLPVGAVPDGDLVNGLHDPRRAAFGSKSAADRGAAVGLDDEYPLGRVLELARDAAATGMGAAGVGTQDLACCPQRHPKETRFRLRTRPYVINVGDLGAKIREKWTELA